MRAHLFHAMLVGAAASIGTAAAGPSSAIFAGSQASVTPPTLTVAFAGGTALLTADAAGNYDETGAQNPDYYFVGICGSSDACNGDDLVSRDYFTFNIASLAGKTIISATLSAYNLPTFPQSFPASDIPGGYISTQDSLPFAIYAATAAASDVTAGADPNAFYDLTAGPLLGRTTVTPDVNDGENVNVNFSKAGLAALGGGGELVIGGSAVPEPATTALLAAGMLGLGLVRRRARQAPGA